MGREARNMKNAIVMAAGKGTRMHSDQPKVLHRILDEPMAEQVTLSCRRVSWKQKKD